VTVSCGSDTFFRGACGRWRRQRQGGPQRACRDDSRQGLFCDLSHFTGLLLHSVMITARTQSISDAFLLVNSFHESHYRRESTCG
jgi:hypothetical protein